MPRADQSAASKVVAFFRTSPLDVADLVFGMSRDALNERKKKSADAKARATGAPATPAATKTAATKQAAPAKTKQAKARKRVRPSRSKAAKAARANGGATHVTTPADMPEGLPPTEFDGEAAGYADSIPQ